MWKDFVKMTVIAADHGLGHKVLLGDSIATEYCRQYIVRKTSQYS